MESSPTDTSLSNEDIEKLVRSGFTVKSVFLREDGFEYIVERSPDLKRNFAVLLASLKVGGGVAVLRSSGEDLLLLVRKHVDYPKSRLRIPLILLLATLATIGADGVLRFLAFEGSITPFIIILYTVSLFGIIGTHELGHKIASARHGVKSSLPYFIPGVPTLLPTFGALIKASEPPVNRDSLFDLGISGPLAGLFVSLLVALGGGLTAVTLSVGDIAKKTAAGSLQEITHLDIFTNLILNIFAKQPEGSGLILSPLTFAASLGFLVTFLNLMPAWQLDGGHVAGAVLSDRVHKYFTYASIIAMFLLGFQLMALLVLFMSFRSPAMKPLDDVSELSKSRKILFVLVLVLTVALYYFTILNNPYFSLSANI